LDKELTFTPLTPWPGDLVCAEGRYIEGGSGSGTEKRAAIFIGPEFGTVTRPDLVAAGDAGFDVLIACAFSMRFDNNVLQLSATDLAKHLACRHLTSLDYLAARGELKRPFWHDPAVDVLAERGLRHETAYLTHLQKLGHQILADVRGLDDAGRLQRTLNAMRSGVGAIVQADLNGGRWRGRADVLLRVNRPSGLGDWSYEVVDTKLARETRGGTILQLCLYSELVAEIQGCQPDRAHVVTPGCDFQPETFRLHDFLAYYRFVKSRLESAVLADEIRDLYPEPVEHCEIYQWWPLCNDRRRKAGKMTICHLLPEFRNCRSLS
jgi:predicted RecB family nuclease